MFDHLTDIYDAMIDWPKRLAAEEPFYRQWFQQVGATRVLDAACGTGRHAAMFHAWGPEVEGADISQAMIERARTTFGELPGIRWAVRAFDQLVDAPGTWDAVVLRGQFAGLGGGSENGSPGNPADDARPAAGRRFACASAQSLAAGRRPVHLAKVPADATVLLTRRREAVAMLLTARRDG